MNFPEKICGCILTLFLLFGNANGETINLNGKWNFDPSVGRPQTWRYSIAVPGLVDMAQPSVNWQSYNCFWYKKTFTLTPSQAHSHAFIKIAQSQYGTEVWLNEKYLGGYIGCYTSHKYDATDAINYSGENTLIIKVGSKDDLPKTGAVGHDYEKISFIPGIWGDVCLIMTGNPVIERAQIVPHIDIGIAEARITLKNLENTDQNIILSSKVFEKTSNAAVSPEINIDCSLAALEEKTFIVNLPISNMKLWSPDNPFLYQLISEVKTKTAKPDALTATFGMREFKIVGPDFYLNGHRVFLKGGNIAFHRFLSDPDRKALPWDEAWIKKILIDIPKVHNFNFFRNHLGQMYNKWYDIADKYGIMLEDEWAFWQITGREDQIKKEFTQWLYDNWNHPSIIIWDAMNEPHDDGVISRGMIRDKIIPAMKQIDPTRPWECGLNANVDFKPGAWKPIDFSEDHPYIYSKGPVLNKYDFGFSRSIEGIKNSNEPTVLNEFIWFWLTKDGQQANIMADVIPRWLGNNSTPEQRLEYQAFLASDLVELFRRIRTDGIAPFVYLSLEGGCTSNWFTGDIANPGLKPIMSALKDAYAPFGVSVELWDRHFLPREKRLINVYVFNDTTQPKSGTLNYSIINKDGSQILFKGSLEVTVPPTDMTIKSLTWTFPSAAGTYYLKAELIENSNIVATSKKIAYISQPVIPANLPSGKIMVYDPDNEILNYLASLGLNAVNYDSATLPQKDILVLGEGALFDTNYARRMQEIADFVRVGHSLIVIEPEYGITNYQRQEYPFLSDLLLSMNKREDKFEGGYDSYCFIDDPTFPLWNNISPEHLKMFNGGWGGEIISQCDVNLLGARGLTLARSGPYLKYTNVSETILNKGVIVISRIETRGRLTEESDPETDLYSRRVDPVAQQYLLNLISTYLSTADSWKRIKKILPLYVKKATASSIQDNNLEIGPEKTIDSSMRTRWDSRHSQDPQWIMLDFGKSTNFHKIILYWENAYAVDYEIQVSDDAQKWKTIYTESNGDGNTDIIDLQPQKARYVRLFGSKRCNNEWGYSLWEIEVY